MEYQALYLRSNVQLEPLIDQWYAWAHLIPPATAARNIAQRHLKIMDSYSAAPEAHARAVKNPKLLGGPFMDFPDDRTAEVRDLRAKVGSQRKHLLDLSAALTDLDALLRGNATGSSLESLYTEVPASLRGFVELVYDLNNQPSFRLIEPLLYRSANYDRSMQSLMLSITSGDDRPFILSTPRFEDERSLQIDVPFDDERVDLLFQLKTKPAPIESISAMLGLEKRQAHLFRSFLTEAPPPPYKRYVGNGARWRYFGHACVLFETKDASILLDPVLSYTYQSQISRYTYDDLPEKIDFVLITHNHQDHILFETLLQLRHRIGTIVVPRNGGGALQDPSLKLLLNACGFRNVVELDDLGQIEFGSGCITGIPFLGEHGDLNVRTKLAYLVNFKKHSILFAADARNISPDLYKRVHEAVGDVDVLFLGMECDGAPMSWIYGPLLTQPLERSQDQSRRLAGSNFNQARALVEQFKCREVYVYAMGQEPWLNHVMSIKYTEQSNPIIESNKLLRHCQERGIIGERLFGEKEILLN